MRIRINNETVHRGAPPQPSTSDEPGPSESQSSTVSQEMEMDQPGPSTSSATVPQEMEMEQGLSMTNTNNEWRSEESEVDDDVEEEEVPPEDVVVAPDVAPEEEAKPEKFEEEGKKKELPFHEQVIKQLDPNATLDENFRKVLLAIGCLPEKYSNCAPYFNPSRIVCPWDSDDDEFKDLPSSERKQKQMKKMDEFFERDVKIDTVQNEPNELLDSRFVQECRDLEESVKQEKKKTPRKRSRAPRRRSLPKRSPSPSLSKSKSPSPMPPLEDVPCSSSSTPTPTPDDPTSSHQMPSSSSSSLDDLATRFNIPEITRIMSKKVPVGIEIDTKSVCRRLARTLKEYGIPQATFSENILRRSQGTLSDLLRNPRPWNMIVRGSETFERMMNWLTLDRNVRVELCKLSMDDAAKVMGFKDAGTKGKGTNRPKNRLTFTEYQRNELIRRFRENQDPCTLAMKATALEMNLQFSTIKNFYTNYRRRYRDGRFKLVEEDGQPLNSEGREMVEREDHNQEEDTLGNEDFEEQEEEASGNEDQSDHEESIEMGTVLME